MCLRGSSCPFVDIFFVSSWIPFVDFFFPLVSFFVALHGPLSSLFQPLGVPSRINLLPPLTDTLAPFVEIFSPFPTLGGSLLSLLQPLSGPSSSFVALRGYLFFWLVGLRHGLTLHSPLSTLHSPLITSCLFRLGLALPDHFRLAFLLRSRRGNLPGRYRLLLLLLLGCDHMRHHQIEVGQDLQLGVH